MLSFIYNIIMLTAMLYRNRDIITMGKPVLLCILQNINLKRLRYNIKINLINLSKRIQIMENYVESKCNQNEPN